MCPGEPHGDHVAVEGHSGVLTFLIADVRGYSRYTEEFGDEAAASLANSFVALVQEGVDAHGGTLVEVRGDEALSVFASARQAIRAAIDLQGRFAEQTDAASDLPLKVGIGIDSGEAVQLEDGSFRGAALNVAARLCARAHGGEVVITEATSRLAGRLAGLQYSDRGRVHLKNIADPMHIFQVHSELEAPAPRHRARSLGWQLGLIVVLIAAVTAAGVVYMTAGGGAEPGNATPPTTTGRAPAEPAAEVALAPDAGLEEIVPAAIWKDCKLQTTPALHATETAVCLPKTGTPDRWEISSYRSGRELLDAYRAEFRASGVASDHGRCNAFTWGGELEWLHGPGKPGGRALCYFDGNDAVIVWTHERRDQLTHRDVLVTAREGGSDHVSLTRWWRPWHHLVGKGQ